MAEYVFMLDDVRILDLCDERGMFAGYLLAHLGADVLAVEPPEGSSIRRLAPFAGPDGAAAQQSLQEDILPLFMLFAVSVTGLLLTVSYTWLKGYGYEFLSITHAVTVIFTLLWLPFGKFFHIFQRPAQLAIKFYKDAGGEGEQAACARCRTPFAAKIHIDDLIVVERELGYRYDWPGHPAGHYQHVCPACRRKMLALAQGRLWAAATENGGSDGR